MLSSAALSAASGGVAVPGKDAPWKKAQASYYGPGTYTTASGRTVVSQSQLFVAHKKLPFGTKVLFRRGGKETVAVVVDRGPFVSGRKWDLSYLAAARLGLLTAGVGQVRFKICQGC